MYICGILTDKKIWSDSGMSTVVPLFLLVIYSVCKGANDGNKVIVSVIALTMLAFPAGMACAAEMHPAEGGTWQYGHALQIKAWSNYWHPSWAHASTVKLRNKQLVTPYAAKGSWSTAEIWAFDGTPSYYYRVR